MRNLIIKLLVTFGFANTATKVAKRQCLWLLGEVEAPDCLK